MEMEQYWAKALQYLEKSMTSVSFHTYVKTLVPLNFENHVFTLRTGDDFFKSIIHSRYLFEINRCVRTAVNADVEVKIISPEDTHPQTRSHATQYAQTNLRLKYVFETFVQGKSNELAYAAARAVAENPGMSNYNPLFLYGGVGLGKTHLMHSIGNFVVEVDPKRKVLYQSTEVFTNEFIAALRENTTQAFKAKYRSCDVLLLDDIQFLVGKESTQEEMFHTFETLYNNNKQLVFTSDQPPKELTSLEKRLTTRFSMGLTVDVTLPDYETRIAILDKKLAIERLVIPDTVKEFIIRNVVSNIRDLEGALNKVTAYARFTNTPLTLALAEEALKDQLQGAESHEVSVPYISQVVADHYNLTVEELCSRSRKQSIVVPRQIAMYLCRKILDASLPSLGTAFGKKDHTTVMHSCNKIAEELESDARLRDVILELEHKIQG